jgi:3-hydroxyacyl-CoA dehydrogenase
VHFFNPVPVMSMVKWVCPLTAGDETMASCPEFALFCCEWH